MSAVRRIDITENCKGWRLFVYITEKGLAAHYRPDDHFCDADIYRDNALMCKCKRPGWNATAPNRFTGENKTVVFKTPNPLYYRKREVLVQNHVCDLVSNSYSWKLAWHCNYQAGMKLKSNAKQKCAAFEWVCNHFNNYKGNTNSAFVTVCRLQLVSGCRLQINRRNVDCSNIDWVLEGCFYTETNLYKRLDNLLPFCTEDWLNMSGGV